MTLGMGGFMLMPDMIVQREVFYKFKNNRVVSSTSWVAAKMLFDIPFSLIEVLIFGNLVYWMVGLQREVGAWLCFSFAIWGFNVAMGSMIRLFAMLAPDRTTAMSMCSTCLIVLCFFAGFLIPRDSIHPWWIWAYYVSPATYTYEICQLR